MSTADEAARAAIDTAGKLAGSVYADMASPAARRVGTALETLFKVGLSPISLLDWGYDRSKEWLASRLAERLTKTPVEFQQAPPSQKAIPLLMAIAASSDSEELRGLYAELLMKAIDSRTEPEVHPSFVSVLSQLSPQEALVFMSFHGKEEGSLFIDRPRRFEFPRAESIEEQFRLHCSSIGLYSHSWRVWLQNLLRLRLLELSSYTDPVYVAPEYERPQPSIDVNEERHMTITEYGCAFLDACAPPSARAEA
ncbi:MAG: Abi-alpha family protein [Pseudomonadota bacterium]